MKVVKKVFEWVRDAAKRLMIVLLAWFFAIFCGVAVFQWAPAIVKHVAHAFQKPPVVTRGTISVKDSLGNTVIMRVKFEQDAYSTSE